MTIRGKDKILKIFSGAAGKRGMPRHDHMERARVNGMPGFVVRTAEGIETVDSRSRAIGSRRSTSSPIQTSSSTSPEGKERSDEHSRESWT